MKATGCRLSGNYPVVPVKSPFEQVHRVSFDHESNLVKTPFSVHYKDTTSVLPIYQFDQSRGINRRNDQDQFDEIGSPHSVARIMRLRNGTADEHSCRLFNVEVP